MKPPKKPRKLRRVVLGVGVLSIKAAAGVDGEGWTIPTAYGLTQGKQSNWLQLNGVRVAVDKRVRLVAEIIE